MDLRFPIWKPGPSNDDPSRVRIQESNANPVDRLQFALLPLNAACHVIPSVLSNCIGNQVKHTFGSLNSCIYTRKVATSLKVSVVLKF